MPRSQSKAAANLESPDSLVRLEAARAIAESGTSRDRAALVRALNREHDPWVRRELGVALRVLNRARSRTDVPELSTDARVDEIRAAVTQQVSDLLLHEVRPLVGSAKLAAAGEISTYDTSNTKRALDRLSDLLEALGFLNRASMAPTVVDEFDIAEAVALVVRSQIGADCNLDAILAGPTPAPTAAPRALFEMVTSNAVRNALESVEQRGDVNRCQGIVLNWGTTDTEHWLCVIDDGMGVPDAADHLFEIGNSNKPEESHFGLGLTIARRAARSMGGEVALSPREPNGATFELRWPRVPSR